MFGELTEFNKSLITIVAIMAIYCICTEKNYRSYFEEHMSNNEFTYGGSKLRIGTTDGVRYIMNKNGVIEVPNSKSAMRRLFDEPHSCS